MKQFYLIICFLFTILSLQAQLSDDFSDGDFLNNPSWNGDAANFIVNNLFQLQLNAPDAGSSILSTAYTIPDSCEWEFYFKMDFAPSNTNLLRIYLISTTADLISAQGYYIEIGETGSTDAIKFYRQDGLSSFIFLGSCTIGSVANQPAVAKMKIKRSHIGEWILSADYAGGNNPVTELLATDNTYGAGPSYFGMYCIYTATRKDKFFFDDIICKELIPDTQVPKAISHEIIDPYHIELVFDEKLNKTLTENISNYDLQPLIGAPSIVSLDLVQGNKISLEFSTPFISPEKYTLKTYNIADLAGNANSELDFLFNYEIGVNPEPNDLLINEIMTDPTPIIGLPGTEFVELYNNSGKLISLDAVSLSDGTSTTYLPKQNIDPEQYIILCNIADTASYKIFGKTIGLSAFPSLNNTGDNLTLKYGADVVISSVNYSDSWYGSTVKKDGGWTLELINPSNTCLGVENWTASISPIGGTPGQKNSAFNNQADITPPSLINAIPLSSNTIELSFNEKIADNAEVYINLFSIDKGISINDIIINADQKSLSLIVDPELISGISYSLSLAPGFEDCAGNVTTVNQTILFTLPAQAKEHDIVINEILFNPKTGSYDFVELYNRSNSIFNIADFKIINSYNGLDIKPITVNKLFYPEQYLVLTENADDIKTKYFVKDTTALVETDLPSYNDDKGTVGLQYDKAGLIIWIDSFSYFDSYHYSLLNDVNGVSLERINPDVFLNGPVNWHSASSVVGFATPTYQNSQYSNFVKPEAGKFTLSANKLSPDQDGFQDEVQILYSLPNPGYTSNIDIYDSSGRRVKQLAVNELLGIEGSFKWDGTTDDNTKARLGIYIIFIEYFNLEGTVLQQKLPVVVAGMTN
ncbi:MAG TPA: lamin tail domain-containing protein [Saprospiraceae bacterium]|nr:lamin tail domain-containing protein [Saprospiraceae bacterium]